MLALIKAVLSSPELTNVEVTPVTVESKPLELTTVYFDLFVSQDSNFLPFSFRFLI